MSTEVDSAVSENFQDGEVQEMNGGALFSAESAQNAPVKEGRVFKKAKRSVRMSPRKSESEEEAGALPVGGGVNGVPISMTKNCRKSKNSRGRGLPKKGGAGGKGTWGKPGSELLEDIVCKDANDPNYDSDNQEPVRIEKVVPQMNDSEFAVALQPILKEYLEHGDTAEVKTLLRDLNLDGKQHKIAELAVSLALDRHDPHRELTSRLISDLSGNIITSQDLGKGFDSLLNNLNDLTLDTPDAPTILGQFIARAIADDCMTSNFISKYKGSVENSLVKQALEKAEVLLEVNHSIHKLDQVWGQGGGNRPVRNLTNKMVLLLREYMSSSDGQEAIRCVKELDVPHFMHELVYQAAVIAIEESSEKAADQMTALLKLLTTTNIITPDEFTKGVKRVFDDMPEICLDVPSAYTLLEKLGNKLHAQGILSTQLMNLMPARGRKRFVSEGDGGKVKC